MAYQRAVKKTFGLKNWDSNHVACQVAGVSTFRHSLAKKIFGIHVFIVRVFEPVLNED